VSSRPGVLLAAIVLGGFAATGCHPTTRAATENTRLKDGAPSVDKLVDRLMQALKDKDNKKLHELRVTEDEYRSLILPGSVDEGRPRWRYSDQESSYLWSMINQKSIYTEANILAAWGGRPLKLRSIKYRGGTKKYADYTAYKQLSLMLEDDHGNEDELRIGSVAEVDGIYKFISFVRS
jgi:hypothetical protein